ncbi:MAG TPA: tetratricopeptide repeat protein [Blastocatellia bacterium]|nr:tetratricopeptide repeat protein [Blastocatellia bacterium]
MKSNLKRLALLALVSIVSLTVYSQSSRGSSGLRESDKAKRGSVDNTSPRTAKNEDGKNETRDGEYWFSRGYALHQSDHYIEAIEAFSYSIGLGFRQATSMYNVACGYALLNDKENALFWLNRSLAAGFDRADLLKDDSDLDPLRSDPRFKEIVQKASFTKKEDKPGKDKTTSRLEDAVSTFEQLRRDSSRDGDEWYKVGSRLLRLRDFDRAATALTQAVDYLPYRGASAMYNLACTYALKGDRELGLEWLEKSINAGFDDSNKLKDDPDIASLRGEPRFKHIQELSRVLSLSQSNSQVFDGSQYSKQHWAPAIKTYESFLRDNPSNGRGWFNLGYALHYSREHARAIQAFEQAIQFGYRKPTALYNIACGHAMMGNRDAAFEWLEKSVDAGFDIEGYILGDDDLESLRSDPRFKRFSRMAEDHQKDKHKSDK